MKGCHKIAICDDETEEILKLKTIASRWNVNCEIDAYTSAEEFLFSYEDMDYDILLLDVEMKQMNGIQLAKRIRQENRRVEIIFITSHFEFIGEGYEVDALHYLVKPVNEQKLLQVLDKAAERLAVEPPYVMVRSEGETVKLYESDIIYVESFLHYIEIHTRKNVYRMKESISAFEKQLSDDFYRIHRSYMVSLKQITRISRTSVQLGDLELPLSRGKYDDINRAFIEHN